jgi:hypothetical protein
MSILMDLSREELIRALDWERMEQLGEGGPSRSSVTAGRDWTPYPKDGFFGDYLEWTLASEAPLDFHFWSGVAAISGACRRTFSLSRGIYRLFASIPVVLVSHSGQGKTTACRAASRLLASLAEINLIESSVTPEMLVQALRAPSTAATQALDANGNLILTASASPVCHGYLFAEELGTLLKRKKYAEDLPTILGNLFDCPPFHGDGSKTSGRSRLINPYLGMLSGITPHGLRTQLPESAHHEGFVSRVMWVYRAYKDRVIPHPPDPSPFLEARLRRHLQGLSALSDPLEMQLDMEAGKWFTSWYVEHGKSLLHRDDSRFTGYLARKPTFLLRLAMILTLGMYPPRRGIDLPTLLLARSIIDREEAHLELVLSAIDTVPMVGDNLQVVRGALHRLWEKGGPANRSDLMRAVSHRLTARSLQDILIGLIAMGEIREETIATSTRPRTVYHDLRPDSVKDEKEAQ